MFATCGVWPKPTRECREAFVEGCEGSAVWLSDFWEQNFPAHVMLNEFSLSNLIAHDVRSRRSLPKFAAHVMRSHF